MRVKTVIDTNTLISGFLWPGKPAQLVMAALSGQARVFTSTELLLEFQEVLQRPKFAARLAAGGETPAGIIEKFRKASLVIIPARIPLPKNLRDADDFHVLACAVAAGADAIISGDNDLLVLRSFEGIPIINAAEALERLKAVQ